MEGCCGRMMVVGCRRWKGDDGRVYELKRCFIYFIIFPTVTVTLPTCKENGSKSTFLHRVV